MSSRRRVSLIFFCCSVIACHTGGAQMKTAAGVTEGTRVRVTMDDRSGDRHTGVAMRGPRDSLVLIDSVPARVPGVPSGALRIALPVANIRSIEVSDGRASGQWAVRGAIIGAIGVGAVTYLAVSGDAKASIQPDILAERASRSIGGLAAVGGALVGASVGALLGAVAAPERWHAPIPPR